MADSTTPIPKGKRDPWWYRKVEKPIRKAADTGIEKTIKFTKDRWNKRPVNVPGRVGRAFKAATGVAKKYRWTGALLGGAATAAYLHKRGKKNTRESQSLVSPNLTELHKALPEDEALLELNWGAIRGAIKAPLTSFGTIVAASVTAHKITQGRKGNKRYRVRKRRKY